MILRLKNIEFTHEIDILKMSSLPRPKYQIKFWELLKSAKSIIVS